MDEQVKEKIENSKEQRPKKNNDNWNESEAMSELDRADKIAERLKRENDRREDLIRRDEELYARRKVGGMTEGGKQQEKPKEETPAEYKERIMGGGASE